MRAHKRRSATFQNSSRASAGRCRRLICMPGLLGALLLPASAAFASCPSDLPTSIDELADLPASAKLVIGDIRIDNGDIFDLEDPVHDGTLHQVLNALHIQTRENVVRNQLLFSEGEALDPRRLAETERYLRDSRYLSDAEVLAVGCRQDAVDLRVHTMDSWSLTPSISFSRKGGQNFGGFEIQETNLFGSGSELKLGWDRDIERDRTELRYADRQLGRSRVGLLASLQDYDEGYRYVVDIGQPFYALDARRSGGVRLDFFDQLDGLYSEGERITRVRHWGRMFDLRYGVSRGLVDGHVLRWTAGLGYDEHSFELFDDAGSDAELPANRRDIYPFIGFEWLIDDYEEARNQDQMARTEDRHMGTRFAVELGYASELLGSRQNALRLEAAASRGFHFGNDNTLMASSALEWRGPDAAGSSYHLDAELRYYRQQSERRLFFAAFNATLASNPDTDRLPALGGDTGLRGYPIRYLNGDATALLTLEQRYFTDWYPFGLFRIGAAAFVDTGRVWDETDVSAPTPGAYTDAGVGLRIASPHSSSGRMLHVDLAYAMDGPPDLSGWQLYIETRKSF